MDRVRRQRRDTGRDGLFLIDRIAPLVFATPFLIPSCIISIVLFVLVFSQVTISSVINHYDNYCFGIGVHSIYVRVGSSGRAQKKPFACFE